LASWFKKISRWMLLYILVGIAAGCMSILFQFLSTRGVEFFFHFLAGYFPPLPGGESQTLTTSSAPLRPYLFLILPTLGGLLCGLLLYFFCPEAEGHGTDAVIESYHFQNGYMRKRVPPLKMLASLLTLTTGGSGGREGPIAQIGAGFGAFLAEKLGLSPDERRVLILAGLGAGIGSIFKAPLAGALFAAEVLYKESDLEAEAILPASIASLVAFSIFASVYGFQGLFTAPSIQITRATQLLPFLFLAVVLAGVGIFYVSTFHAVHNYFKKLNIPNYFKPALGGLLTGIIGFFWPHTLGFGYGYLQQAINNELTLLTLLTLGLGKIFTTSFTISSGGSGGVFGPSIVIGGAIGGLVGNFLHFAFPTLNLSPSAFVIVSMAGFFAGVSNTPIATIIFISELTGSYELLIPSLLVCSLTYILMHKWTIYSRQVANKFSSPAHKGELFLDIMQEYKVKELINEFKKPIIVSPRMTLQKFKTLICKTKRNYFCLVENNTLKGIIDLRDIRPFLYDQNINDLIVMDDLALKNFIYTHLEEDLASVFKKFGQKNIEEIPVVKDEPGLYLVGMLSRKSLILFYNQKINALKNNSSYSSSATARK